MRRRRNILFDQDTYDFITKEYNYTDGGVLINMLIRNFITPFRQADLQALFEQASERTAEQLQEDFDKKFGGEDE